MAAEFTTTMMDSQPERHATPNRALFAEQDLEEDLMDLMPDIENPRESCQDYGQGAAMKQLALAENDFISTNVTTNVEFNTNNYFPQTPDCQDAKSFVNGTQNLVRFCETKNFYVYTISSQCPTPHYLGHCQSPVQLYSQMAESKTDMGVYDIMLNRSRYLISYNYAKTVMPIPPQEEMNDINCVTLRTPKTEQFKIELIDMFKIKFVHVRNQMIMLMVNLSQHDNSIIFKNIWSMVADESLYSLPFCKNYVTDSGSTVSSRALMSHKEEKNNDVGHPYVESILKASLKLSFQKVNLPGDIEELSKKLKHEYETKPSKHSENKDTIKFSYKYGSIAKMYFGAPLCNGLTRIKVERIGDAGMIVDYVNQSGKRYTDQDSFIMIHLCNGGRVIITKTKDVFVWIVSQLNPDELNIDYLLPSLHFGKHHIYTQSRLGKVEMYRRHNILLWFASLYFNNTISLEDMDEQMSLYCRKIKTSDDTVSESAAKNFQMMVAETVCETTSAVEEANNEAASSDYDVSSEEEESATIEKATSSADDNSSDYDMPPVAPIAKKRKAEDAVVKTNKVQSVGKQPKKKYLTKKPKV